MSCKNDVCTLKENHSIHVVLVEPANSLNIGSVARAMLNLGFSSLRLVNPLNYNEEKALATACWADEIIKNADFFDTLEDALSDLEEVVGFTSRHGKYRPGQTFLPNWIEEIKVKPLPRTALIFGNEQNGLRREHIELCRWLVRIPSTVDNPVFNLAQSVLLALYEISKIEWQDFSDEVVPDLPTWNEFYHLDRLVTGVLQRIGFYRKGSPDTIPGLVQNLLRRIKPDAREMRVLLGIFGKIDRTLNRAGIEGGGVAEDGSYVDCQTPEI